MVSTPAAQMVFFTVQTGELCGSHPAVTDCTHVETSAEILKQSMGG